MADEAPPPIKIQGRDGRPPDVVDLAEALIQSLAPLRAGGRVPIAVGLLVELPEPPMGAERGSACTIQVPFTTAETDPGLLGAVVRSLTRKESNG